jgi:hypothetical protein
MGYFAEIGPPAFGPDNNRLQGLFCMPRTRRIILNTPDLKTLHIALGGEIFSGQVLCPGPGHSQRDRSLSVKPAANANGFIVHSFAPGDDFRTCSDYVNQCLGLPQWRPGERRRNLAPSVSVRAIERAAQDGRIERAKEIWEEARDPIGTMAEKYLTSRKLNLPPELCGSVLRFHPQCPWRNEEIKQIEFLPCLIAAFTSIDGDTVTGIHRIRLDQPERWPKTQRRMQGVVAGAAIKFDAIIEGGRLAIAEGIETALAARQLRINPVWALGAAGAIAKFAPIEGIEELTILGERDVTSRKAADACALLWAQQRQRVFLALPAGGENDFNDALMGAKK